jgi:hypothetical protein
MKHSKYCFVVGTFMVEAYNLIFWVYDLLISYHILNLDSVTHVKLCDRSHDRCEQSVTHQARAATFTPRQCPPRDEPDVQLDWPDMPSSSQAIASPKGKKVSA